PLELRAGAPRILAFRRRAVWTSALAALLVLGVAVAAIASYLNQVVAVYPLAGDSPGEAVVVMLRSGALALELRGAGDPPPGYVYEAWIIPAGRQPVAAGVTARGEGRLPLPREAHGQTVAVTVEPGPEGVSAPTSPPLKAGTVGS
ncbi:MAG: anti-sigma factor, partial [Chloroflexota bacterium]|nr:anti-sigma factor [Chloroflexota bacterium]